MFKSSATLQPELRHGTHTSFVGQIIWARIIYWAKVRKCLKKGHKTACIVDIIIDFGVPVVHLRHPACRLLARNRGLTLVGKT